MWQWMVCLSKTGTHSYSDDFNLWLQTVAPTRHYRSKDRTKQAILAFVRANKRRPSQTAADLKERRLGIARFNLTLRTRTGGQWYDPDFKRQLDELIPSIPETNKGALWNRTVEFVNVTGRLPKCHAVEKSLWRSLLWHKENDPRFAKYLEML
jgi:hypothetical protein